MENNPILEFVEKLKFFDEFSDDEKSKLVNTIGIFQKFKDGQTIITEGETGSSLFVVLTGAVRIAKLMAPNVQDGHISLQEKENVIIADLKAGSIFGEVSLVSSQPRNTSAIASSKEVVVMKIGRENIEKFSLAIQKKFQKQLILTLAQRLDDMNSKYIKLKSSITKG